MSKDKPLTEVNLVRWIKLVATICLLIPATPSKSESGADELSAAQGLPAVTQANRVLRQGKPMRSGRQSRGNQSCLCRSIGCPEAQTLTPSFARRRCNWTTFIATTLTGFHP
jgi:hypothetical protein